MGEDRRIQTAEDGHDIAEKPARRRRQLWPARVGVLLPVLFVLTLLTAATIRHQQTLAVGAAVVRGETPPVPDVTLPALDGPPVSLRAFLGHPVILNFWASWCIPCRDEAPRLEGIWQEFRPQGLIVLGVDTQDLEGPARAFVREFHITYPTLRDPNGSVARLFGTTGVPETFFIGRDGRILGKFPGSEVGRAAWRAAASALLSGQARVP